jgi:hypothetical protein
MNNACEHGPYDGRASAALESKYEKETFAISGLETFDPSSVATAFGGETPDRFYTRSLSKNKSAPFRALEWYGLLETEYWLVLCLYAHASMERMHCQHVMHWEDLKI